MLTPARPWVRRSIPDDVVAELEQDLKVAPLTARLLALRGLHGAAEAQRWFARRLQDLHQPELMRGVGRAAKRLAEAIDQRQRILIHGDYDVDGSTSASLLTLFVRACSHEAEAFVPHRRIDGYGLGEASLDAVKEHRAQVLITVDCGIADHGWAKRIETETGCDVIITDHHLPQGDLPQCFAVCNPNHPECQYPDKHLAGVGVAWKLALATARVLSGGGDDATAKVTPRLREFLMDALALVALGTVADCASLDGENRILVHHGLLALAKTAQPGLRTLLEQARLSGDIAAGDVGWKLGPLLNAAGRVGSAMDTIRLLTARTPEVAREALTGIVAENEERKRLTLALTVDLSARIEADPGLRSRAALVFAGEGWHQGVVGIVASRLVEQFHKPAVVIAIMDGQGKGSLRTIGGVHLGEAIAACKDHIIKGGGHALAAGLSIDPAKIPEFTAAFEAYVGQRRPGDSAPPRTEFDAEARLGELDDDFYNQLEAMAPFGIGNPEPLLQLTSAAFLGRPRLFGKEGDHLRGILTDAGGGARELMVWKARKQFTDFSEAGARFDLLVRPQAGRFRGQMQPRLVFVDGKAG